MGGGCWVVEVGGAFFWQFIPPNQENTHFFE
jgi:hypothetical protein